MTLTVCFMAAGVLFLLPHQALAQTANNYNDAFLQYNLKMEEYKKAHETYVLKRAQYIKFKSLQSEKEAHDATVLLLQTRDDVTIYYINAIKLRMQETAGVTDEQKTVMMGLLDQETKFFSDHKARIPSTGTLQDLVTDSNLAKDEMKKAEPVFYQTLFTISDGKLTDMRARLGDNFTQLKAKIDMIRNETKPEYQFSLEKMQSIDRFIFESENKIERADDKKTQAEAIKPNDRQAFTAQDYTQRLGVLAEAQQLLKEASSFLKEIVSEVKKQ